MKNEAQNAEERFHQETLFKKIGQFLIKPFKHGFTMLFILFFSTTYFFFGFGLVTNPSLTLFYSRNPGLETEAVFFLKRQGIDCADSPKVYILTKEVRELFYWPYVFTFRLMIDEIRYSGQIYQSYSMIEDSTIVMQEEESYDYWIFAHEVGHLAHFCSNPDGFNKQTPEQKEKFAESFREAIQIELQSKESPYR